MIAGALDRRISVLRQGPAIDDGYTTTPGELGVLASRWASWKPANGREVFENQGRKAIAGGSFWLRSDTTTRRIVETDKVAFEGRLWDILSVTQIGRRDGLELIVASDDEETEIDLTGLSPIPDATVSYTGWAAYVHTGAVQTLTAGNKVPLVNNSGSVIETQKPADIVHLYDGTVITGRNGDSIMIAVEFTFTPSDGDSSELSVNIDIGGSVGELYAESFPITQGQDVPHKVSYHPPAYTLDTWTANGGFVEVRCDGPGAISTVRYVIHRLHKAR